MNLNPKVSAGVLAGAISTILIWLASEFGGVSVPGGVASAITTLLTFAVSYMTPAGAE